VDSILSGVANNVSVKSGYNFGYTPEGTDASGRINGYSFIAWPVTVGTTGTNYYFTDQLGVIGQNSTAQTTSSDSPIAGWPGVFQSWFSPLLPVRFLTMQNTCRLGLL